MLTFFEEKKGGKAGRKRPNSVARRKDREKQGSEARVRERKMCIERRLRKILPGKNQVKTKRRSVLRKNETGG